MNGVVNELAHNAVLSVVGQREVTLHRPFLLPQNVSAPSKDDDVIHGWHKNAKQTTRLYRCRPYPKIHIGRRSEDSFKIHFCQRFMYESSGSEMLSIVESK